MMHKLRLLLCTLLFALLFTLFSTGCGLFSDGSSSSSDGHWYNTPVLRSVFGDYDHTEKLYISDPEDLAKYQDRGSYLVNSAADCGMCHAKPDDPKSLSGGKLLTDSYGLVRAANITPDKETGIGNWDAAEIMRAIRASIDREGRPISLDFHRAYRWMSDRDAKAIAVYLLSLAPENSEIERRRLGGFERNRFGFFPEHRDFSGYVPELPKPRKTADVPEDQTYDARWGRYLAHNVAQCYTCHTADPGAPTSGLAFAGGHGAQAFSILSMHTLTSLFEAKNDTPAPTLELLSPEGREMAEEQGAQGAAAPGPSDAEVKARDDAFAAGKFPLPGPDIRGSSTSGLANWSVEDIMHYLSSGELAGKNRTVDGELCPWPAYSKLTAIDKRSIAAYLKQL